MENLENVKEDNRNKRESSVGGGDKCKNPKGVYNGINTTTIK